MVVGTNRDAPNIFECKNEDFNVEFRIIVSLNR